jgi:PIN like domain
VCASLSVLTAHRRRKEDQMASDVVLFIDANQYLKLYGMVVTGKDVLDWLEEQQDHIFISAQIVDEVFRNKLGSAQKFFADKLKLNVAVPDHLLGISGEKINALRQNIQKAKDELSELVSTALCKISWSEDDVSQKLKGLFDKAVSPCKDQMERARDRKERGNPPGKQKDTLGDQITWEQLLSYCKGVKQLWIITADGDYGIKHEKMMLLNSLLRRDLTVTCGAELEIHYYHD